MEERIIDDEYGRGIRLKKTENGYVDVTDELSEKKGEEPDGNESEEIAEGEAAERADEEIGGQEDELAEEVLFEFPEEDDEELAALSFEEAKELKRKREEERKKHEEAARKYCEEGEKYLENNAYEKAAEAFDSAMNEIHGFERAALGFWRAKTERGANLQPLLDEWAEEGYDSFLVTFGEECVRAMKKEYAEAFEKAKAEREAEIASLKPDFEEQTEKRRAVLKERIYNARKKCIPLLSVEIALAVFTLVFALNIFSRADSVFVWFTIACGAAFVVVLPFFCMAASRLTHAISLSRANESKSSTGEGRKLEKLENETEFLKEFL